MSLDAGTIVAEAQLDVGQFDTSVTHLVQQVDRVNTAFTNLKVSTPRVSTEGLQADAQKATTLAKEVADAIGHLSGGRVSIDISQLEQAGADAQKILGTITTGLADTAAAATAFSVVVVAAFVAVEHEIVEMGEHWEAAFRQISVSTGKTGEDLERFEASALRVGLTTGKAPEALTTAMAELSTRLHIADADLEATTSSVLKFAAVTRQDAGVAASELAKSMTAFHEPAANAAQDMNILLRVSQQTRIPIAQLEEQMHGHLAPTLQALGFDFASTAVLIGEMSKQTDGGRAAMLGFNKILEEAAAAGKNPREVFAQIVAELKATGDVSTATGGKLATELGARGFALLSSLAKNGALDVKDASNAIRTSGDTVDDAFGRMRSGAEEITRQLGILKAQFAPLGIEIAKAVNALENQLAGGIGNITAKIREFQTARQQLADSLPPQVVQGAKLLAATPFGLPLAPLLAGLGRPGGAGGAGAAGGGEGGGGIAGQADVAATSARTLATEITRLQKQLDDAAADKGLIQNLLEMKQTLEEAQRAIGTLPPALGAQALAQIKAAQAAEEDAKAAAADAAALQEQADAAEAARVTADGHAASLIHAARQANEYAVRLDGVARSAHDVIAVDAALVAATAAQVAANDAAAAANAGAADATEKATKADQAAIVATILKRDAQNDAAKALEAAISVGATFAVQQERANTLIASAKPFLDADTEASIKVAIAKKDLAGAVTLAGRAIGLTDAQLQAFVGSLGGSQAALDQEVASIKALQIPHEELLKSLGALASAAYPNLTRVQADHVRQVVAVGDADRTAAELAKLYGISVDELKTHLADTGAHFDTYVKQLAAANRALADFVSDEKKTRITSTLGALTSGVDAATAAQAKQLQESGHDAEALTLLASKYGVGAEQALAWKTAVEQGGAAAQLAAVQIQLATAVTGDMGKAIFAAKEQLSALTTFARDPNNGTIRLKIDIDIDAAQRKISDLQEQFAAASKQRATEETKATDSFLAQQQTLATQISVLDTNHQASLLEIADARSRSTDQLNRDIAKAVTTSNAAQTRIGEAEVDAISKHALAISDAQSKLAESLRDLTERYGEQVTSLAEKGREAIEALGNAQASALRALSSAMQTFNQQQVQAAFTASVAANQAQFAQFAPTTGPGINTTGVQLTNAQLASQIAAAGQAGLTEQDQQTTLAKAQLAAQQQLVDAQKALRKATEDNTDALDKATAAFTRGAQNALLTASTSIRNADLEQNKTLRDQKEAGDRAQAALDAAQAEAQRQDRERQRALAQRQDDETRRFVEERDRLLTQQTDQQRAFRESEALRTNAEAEATRRDRQALSREQTALDTLQQLRDDIVGAVTQPGAAPLNISFNRVVNQETGVDFLRAAVQRLDARVRGGV